MRSFHLGSSFRKLVLVGACALGAQSASAFAVFPIDAGHSLKWGANANGTAGGTIHWSFITEGTSGDIYCSTACTGSALTSLNIENGPGLGYTLTPLTRVVSASSTKPGVRP